MSARQSERQLKEEKAESQLLRQKWVFWDIIWVICNFVNTWLSAQVLNVRNVLEISQFIVVVLCEVLLYIVSFGWLTGWLNFRTNWTSWQPCHHRQLQVVLPLTLISHVIIQFVNEVFCFMECTQPGEPWSAGWPFTSLFILCLSISFNSMCISASLHRASYHLFDL